MLPLKSACNVSPERGEILVQSRFLPTCPQGAAATNRKSISSPGEAAELSSLFPQRWLRGSELAGFLWGGICVLLCKAIEPVENQLVLQVQTAELVFQTKLLCGERSFQAHMRVKCYTLILTCRDWFLIDLWMCIF